MRYFLFLLFPFPVFVHSIRIPDSSESTERVYCYLFASWPVANLPWQYDLCSYLIFFMWMTQKMLIFTSLFSLMNIQFQYPKKYLWLLVFDSIQMRFMEPWVPNCLIEIKFVEVNKVKVVGKSLWCLNWMNQDGLLAFPKKQRLDQIHTPLIVNREVI
jgi:hypothetical protein